MDPKGDGDRRFGDPRETQWREWMIAAQNGDAARYDKLLRELFPFLRGFVQLRLADPALTEDAVQSVLISVHRARHTYRAERPFGPWIRAIARNTIVDFARVRARRRSREVDIDAVEHTLAAPAEVPLERARLSPELGSALEALPAKQRQAVELLHLECLSVAEAAERVGISKAALKVRAHRGYRALRARLDREFEE